MRRINEIRKKENAHHKRVFSMFFGFIAAMFYMAIVSSSKPDCCCDCPGYVKKETIELQYEKLIRPLVVEAVGFQGIVLKDSIGSIFVISDDKMLHEIIEYSYNVGDTIK